MARTWTMTPRLWQPVCKAQVQNWVRNLKTGVAKLTRRRPTVIEKHARDSGSACEESLQRFFFYWSQALVHRWDRSIAKQAKLNWWNSGAILFELCFLSRLSTVRCQLFLHGQSGVQCSHTLLRSDRAGKFCCFRWFTTSLHTIQCWVHLKVTIVHILSMIYLTKALSNPTWRFY